MTKSELIGRIAHKQPLLAGRDVELAVKVMLEHMTACLAAGGRIEVRGFGSFSLRFRRGRVGRDPRTGSPVALRSKSVPHFKPGKALRERVDRLTREAHGELGAGNDFLADAESQPGTGRRARSACAWAGRSGG